MEDKEKNLEQIKINTIKERIDKAINSYNALVKAKEAEKKNNSK